MTPRSTFVAVLLLPLLAAASCADSSDELTRNNVPIDDPNKTPDPAAPACTDFGKGYVGFAGTKLEDKRVNAAIGADRARMKPYSVLKSEYERTIGVASPSLDTASATFGLPPDRFAREPHASAIQIYTAFRVAFDGCLTYTETTPDYANAPTADTAKTQCTTMARKFWSRAPTADEVNACTQAALVDSAPEGTPRRRWAYTCAAVLSSAGFLTY